MLRKNGYDGRVNLNAVPLDRDSYRVYGDVVEAGPRLPSTSANAGTALRYDRLGSIENLRPGATPNLCVFRAERYLVVVCEGRDAPDPRTLKAFVARTGQGITYRPGIWHHPLIALDQPTDFACLVYEDGSQDDGEVRDVVPAVKVMY